MRNFIKYLIRNSPTLIKVLLLYVRESYFRVVSAYKEKKYYPRIDSRKKKSNKIKNILVYHISGMYYAGTEKTLQLVANQLADEFNVFFMYGERKISERQKDMMDSRVNLIEFNYSEVEPYFPYFIKGMHPHIKEVIDENDIDLLITADSGHSQYPFNLIRNIPIILINIFGSPSIQKNIISTIFISKTIQDYSESFTGKQNRHSWAHLAVIPSPRDVKTEKNSIRKKLGIPEHSFTFGRIGRGDDSIFDPIGINSFKKVLNKYPESYYLIMSPPPILKRIVEEENIPNVIFMSDKEDIWDFYGAIDTLAHFRLDGETFGLNIAEAMWVGNPIISHKSHIWNAHLEYLQPNFSRVAEKNNVTEYASFMEEFIDIYLHDPDMWEEMKRSASQYAMRNFSKEKYAGNFRDIIRQFNERKII